MDKVYTCKSREDYHNFINQLINNHFSQKMFYSCEEFLSQEASR